MRKSSLLPLLVLAACSSSSPGGGGAIHAELQPLMGFSYDSGVVPDGSPVQVQLVASAAGKLTLDAADATPGSGTFAIDAGIALAATLHSTLPGAGYDGPIQGAPDLSIKIAGTTPFDPMVVGHPAMLMAPITPSTLVTVPLAVALGIPGVDGDLTLTLVSGTVTSQFTGTCADSGHFSGTVTTSGTVVLGGTLTVAVPIVGSKTFDLPAMTMDIPSADASVVFATPDDPSASGCSTAPAGDGTDGGTMPGDDGGTTPSDGGTTLGDGGADPNAQWEIVVKSASFGNRGDGSAWDPSGLPDPYVEIKVGAKTFKTTVLVDQSGSATWNQTIGIVHTSELMAANGFDLSLLDRDADPAEHLGGAYTDPSEPGDDLIGGAGSIAYYDGATRTLDLSYGGVTASVTYQFFPHQ